MNKRILIVVPVLALLICVACLSSGGIGSANPNNQTGEQGSVLGNLQLIASETPSPSVTPMPSMTPYYTPTVWQFDPLYAIFDSGYYDSVLNAVILENYNKSVLDTNPKSICGKPEFLEGLPIAYISDSTNSFWGDKPIPSDEELFGYGVMKIDTCTYEIIWVAPAPFVGANGNDFVSEVYDPIVDDENVYQISNFSGEQKVVSVLTDETVFLGCGDNSWNPNNEDIVLVFEEYVPNYSHRNAKWVAQVDCASMFDNGNSGRIIFSDKSQDFEVEYYDQWPYLKQVATDVANLPLDSEEYQEFVEIYENLPMDEWYSAERIGFGNDTTVNAYHAYSMMATLDTEYKNIELDSFAEYVKNQAAIAAAYGWCYASSDCYSPDGLFYRTLDWRMLTATPTPYQSETPSP